eukprot:PhM_4_TR15886/c5_g1_i2/m.17009
MFAAAKAGSRVSFLQNDYDGERLEMRRVLTTLSQRLCDQEERAHMMERRYQEQLQVEGEKPYDKVVKTAELIVSGVFPSDSMSKHLRASEAGRFLLCMRAGMGASTTIAKELYRAIFLVAPRGGDEANDSRGTSGADYGARGAALDGRRPRRPLQRPRI